MKLSHKMIMLTGAALGALSLAPVVSAQEAPKAEAKDNGEVVVTARRRSEFLKDVPISVSSFSGETLSKSGASDITALQQQAPNMTLQTARGSNSTLIGFIRGVGQQDPLWGFEPGVGLYIDDVYIARPQGAVLDVYDVQRIEVLRGPQGTLYGRNTIGGAIKYVTKPLSLTRPAFDAKVALGSFNQRDLIVSGSVPLSSSFAIGAAVADLKHDGYGKNLLTGAQQYNKDVLAYRVSALFKPNADFSATFNYDNYLDKSNARHGHREVVALGASPAFTNPAYGNPPAGLYDTYAGLGDKNRVKNDGESIAMEYKLNDQITLKSITSARKGSTQTNIDFDNTPAKLLDVPAKYDDTQETQEFQLLYSGQNWSTVAGLYYLNATASGAFDTIVSNGGATVATAGKVRTQSVAAFFDASLKLSDKLSISFGGRGTDDKKRGSVYRATYLGSPSPFFGGTQSAAFLLRTNYTNTRKFSRFTPKASLSYKFNSDVTGYMSIGEGFKSGGFDMRGDAIFTPSTVNGYAPETVVTSEAGLKGTAFDHHLNFGTAIFHSDYTDMQITHQTPVGATVASQVENAGKAHVNGFEFEGNLKVNDMVSANATIGYLDAKYDRFISYDIISASYANLASSAKFQMTPKWTNNFGMTFKGNIAGGAFSVNPTASYRSDMQMFEFAAPLLDQKAYWLYNLNMNWTAPAGHIRMGVYGKNLSDKHYKTGGYNFPGAALGNSVVSFYGAPRTWTFQLEYKY